MIARVTLGPTLLLLFCTTGALAQETAAGEASKWMLGITFPHKAPDYFNFSDNGTDGSVGFNDSEWTPTPDNNDRAHPRPISLDFAYRMEGGIVRLRVSIRYSSEDGARPQTREVLVGTYVVRQNESVKISELSHFGLNPVEVNLVTAKIPDSTLPMLVNRSSSLIVEGVDEDRANYKLALRNASPFAVDGLIVALIAADSTSFAHHLGATIPPLISAGGRSEVSVLKDGNATTPLQLVIEAVVFENGTYEGDESNAAILEGRRVGRETQMQRVADLVERELRTTTTDTEKAESLRSDVSALSAEPEPNLIKSVMARFPTKSDSTEESVRNGLHDGLLMGKGFFLNNLNLYLHEMAQGPTVTASLQEWWDATRGQCGLLVKSCGKDHP